MIGNVVPWLQKLDDIEDSPTKLTCFEGVFYNYFSIGKLNSLVKLNSEMYMFREVISCNFTSKVDCVLNLIVPWRIRLISHHSASLL